MQALLLVILVALPGVHASVFGVGETITSGVHVGVGDDTLIGVAEAIEVGKVVRVGVFVELGTGV